MRTHKATTENPWLVCSMMRNSHWYCRQFRNPSQVPINWLVLAILSCFKHGSHEFCIWSLLVPHKQVNGNSRSVQTTHKIVVCLCIHQTLICWHLTTSLEYHYPYKVLFDYILISPFKNRTQGPKRILEISHERTGAKFCSLKSLKYRARDTMFFSRKQ